MIIYVRHSSALHWCYPDTLVVLIIYHSSALHWCRQVLKAVETKSKEEIEHERAREPLVEAVGDARVRKQIHDHRLGTLLQKRDTYIKTKK